MKNVPDTSVLRKQQQMSVKKILVIENDPDLTNILEYLFKAEGYQYKIYVDAEDICTLAMEFRPDVIILDYVLQHINGGELCSQLKNSAQTKGIPVIIYSAVPKAFLSLGDYGCDLFIPKPFDLDELIEKINCLILI